MKRLIILGAVWALAVARPELYKEKEDFQYSRSSSDDGTRSGFYGAQRGNMGGNYERAHNMDALAQNQMSGLVRQVDGELGDGARTRTGSVYSAANSRGTYGSGHYDLSNLAGRNFQEGGSYGDSHSQSSLSSSAASNAEGYFNRQFQSSMYSGHQAAGHSGLNLQTDDLQALDNTQGTGQYAYGRKTSHSSGYNAQTGYQQHNEFDTSNTNLHSGGYGSNVQPRLVTAAPARIYLRPGTRVVIPVAVQTSDVTHGSSVIDHNSLNSEAEVLSNENQRASFIPNNSKHYESSYNYRKQWEKHDTVPSTIISPTSTDSPFPKNSELYEDTQLHTTSDQYDARRVDSQRLHSNIYSGYNANVKSTSGQSRLNYDTQRNGASSQTNTNAHTQAGYGTSASSDSSLNNYNIRSQYNAGRHHGLAGDATLSQVAGINTDLNSQVENLNSKPKSYQSSYSYHKSWERQGDPYVIKPASNGYYDSLSSQRLSTGSLQNLGIGSNYEHSHQNVDCDENGHIRVARSIDQYQDVQQQSQNLEDLGQQVQDLGQQNQNLEDLGQQVQDLGQQNQNLEDLGQQLVDLGQQSQNLEDFEQQVQNVGQQSQNLQDFGQQSQNLGQQSQNLEDFGEQSENLGQQSQNLEDFGQLSENLGQQTQSLWGQQDVQQSQNTWDELENLSQQAHNKWDAMQHTWDKFEDLGQQTQDIHNQFTDLDQNTQNDFRQRTQDTETRLKNNKQDQQSQEKSNFDYEDQNDQANFNVHDKNIEQSDKFNQHDIQSQKQNNQMGIWDQFDLGSNHQSVQPNTPNMNDQKSIWDQIDTRSYQNVQRNESKTDHTNVYQSITDHVIGTQESHNSLDSFNWNINSNSLRDQQSMNTDISPNSPALSNLWNKLGTIEQQSAQRRGSDKIDKDKENNFSQVNRNIQGSDGNPTSRAGNKEITSQEHYNNLMKPFDDLIQHINKNNVSQNNTQTQKESSLDVGRGDISPEDSSEMHVNNEKEKGQNNYIEQSLHIVGLHGNIGQSNTVEIDTHNKTEHKDNGKLDNLQQHNLQGFGQEANLDQQNQHDFGQQANLEQENLHDFGQQANLGQENLHDFKQQVNLEQANLHDFGQPANLGRENLHDFGQQANLGQENLHDFGQRVNLEQEILHDFGQQANLEQQNMHDFKKQDNLEKVNPRHFEMSVENVEQQNEHDLRQQVNFRQENQQDFGQQVNFEQQNSKDLGQQVNMEQQNLHDFGQQVNLEQQNLQDFGQVENLHQPNVQDFGQQAYLEQHTFDKQNVQNSVRNYHFEKPEQVNTFQLHDNGPSETNYHPPENVVQPEEIKRRNNDLQRIPSSPSTVSPIEPVTEKVGFWKSIGNKFSSAKSKIASWF